MTVLTKTERELLDRAAVRGHGHVETVHGRGPYGGLVRAGARERTAMFKLESAGLIEIVSRDPWTDYNRGYCQSGTVFCYRLVNKSI